MKEFLLSYLRTMLANWRTTLPAMLALVGGVGPEFDVPPNVARAFSRLLVAGIVLGLFSAADAKRVYDLEAAAKALGQGQSK